ncbi:MAG: hypothetical protein ACYDBH_12325 [Acidobacteriaceae bacterium]
MTTERGYTVEVLETVGDKEMTRQLVTAFFAEIAAIYQTIIPGLFAMALVIETIEEVDDDTKVRSMIYANGTVDKNHCDFDQRFSALVDLLVRAANKLAEKSVEKMN